MLRCVHWLLLFCAADCSWVQLPASVCYLAAAPCNPLQLRPLAAAVCIWLQGYSAGCCSVQLAGAVCNSCFVQLIAAACSWLLMCAAKCRSVQVAVAGLAG
jgi:hypothetical protein